MATEAVTLQPGFLFTVVDSDVQRVTYKVIGKWSLAVVEPVAPVVIAQPFVQPPEPVIPSQIVGY